MTSPTSSSSPALTPFVRLAYGLGGAVQAVKDATFIHFVPFFYAQVVGLSPELYGVAAMVGQFSDAITDPLVGTWSDGSRSRWGRRHPWMLASALPLMALLWLFFHPPEDASQTVLCVWVIVVGILLRTALTMFNIPLAALGAELSTDYVERTRIASLRVTTQWFGGVLLPTLAYLLVFRTIGERDGRLVAENYDRYAVICALASLGLVLLSTLGTRSVVPSLPQPDKAARFNLLDPFRDVLAAVRNRNFRWIFACMLLLGLASGTGTMLATFGWAYIWEFTPTQVSTITLSSLLPTVLAFAAVGPLSRRFQKGTIVIGTILVIALNAIWWFGGRLIDVLPANHTSELMWLAYLHQVLVVFPLVVQMAVLPSMIADVTDEHELETGERKDGVFQAATGFALKVPLGFGQAAGGFAIAWAGLESGAAPGAVEQLSLDRLALVAGPGLAAIYVVALFTLLRYDLSRERHAELRRALARRSADRT